jgi:hypothetical protein
LYASARIEIAKSTGMNDLYPVAPPQKWCTGIIQRSMDEVVQELEETRMDIPPEDILVTVAHPWSDIEVTLAGWMKRGPGPRPFLRAINPRLKATGEPLPDDVIPLAYQNTVQSRDLIRRGLVPNPWPANPVAYPPEEF